MAKILGGKDVAQTLNEDTTAAVERLKQKHIFPTLATIRLGQKQDDVAYEASIVKKADTVGVAVNRICLDSGISQEALAAKVAELSDDPSVHGILLFRPLPSHLDEQSICNRINPDKDVDGISDVSMGRVFAGKPDGFGPCTAESVMAILKHYEIPLGGKRVVVLGRSLVIGKPVSMMLLGQNATVTICHRSTQNLPEECAKADVLVAAAGKAGFVDSTFVTPGQTVIDVGINVDESGRLCGDVDYLQVEPVVSAITPVPGGVGTVTTAILLSHVVQSAARSNKG